MKKVKTNVYLKELIETLLIIAYCILETIGLLVGGLFIASVITYYAWYGKWDNMKVANIMNSILATFAIIVYSMYIVQLKKFINNISDSAICMSLVLHSYIIVVISYLYYGENIINIYSIITIIGMSIIFLYLLTYCKNKMKKRMLRIL